MKPFILLITILIALASCRSPQQIADRKCAKAQAKYERSAYRWGCPLVVASDTIRITQTLREVRDTTVYVTIAADTVKSTDTLYRVNGIYKTPVNRVDVQYAFSTAYVWDGILYHNIFQKPDEIAYTIQDAIQNSSHTEYIIITKTINTKTNYLTQWQVFQLWMGRILMGLLLLVLSYIGIKFLLKRMSPL